MPQGWPDDTGRLMGTDIYTKISAASNNAANIKASPGVVCGYYLVNLNTAFRYVKLFDKASSPTVGTDSPVATFGVPPESAANIAFPNPIGFNIGIGICMVTGIALLNNGAVAADEMAATIYYL